MQKHYSIFYITFLLKKEITTTQYKSLCNLSTTTPLSYFHRFFSSALHFSNLALRAKESALNFKKLNFGKTKNWKSGI